MNPSSNPEHLSAASLATIRYWWWWASHDLAYLENIASSGKLNAQSARSIAKDYLVARGVPRDEEDRCNTKRYEALANALSSRGNRLRNEKCMSNRLAICFEAINELRNKSDRETVIIRNDFVSGISKLAWFIAPKGWTMFDRLAAEAVGVRLGNAREKATNFYAYLQNKNFPGLAERMNKAIALSGVTCPHFYAERIVDQYLWLHSATQYGDEEALIQAKTAAFLRAVGSNVKTSLLNLSRIIDTNFAEDLKNLIPDAGTSKQKNK